ncbi:MAG: hypothetical protein CMN85_10770 [Spongiibacteraceae bacterium]|uniref:hypothetical protein n=1 Tax=uncultured Haliea sp. TaxID=622616 RepID=UPI000C553193|nr:hypothetical protein [Spongiibacteraceae bacterium]
MGIEFMHGWRKGPTIRGEESYMNDDREMMILTTATKSTLAKENEVFVEFTGPTHFYDAVRKCDEIWAEHYAMKN